MLVVGEGHFVGFAADAGLFVAAEGGVGGVHVVAVGPDAAGFDAAADAVGAGAVAAPDAGAQAEVGVVCDGDGFVFFLKGCERFHWPNYLFL